MDRTIYTLRQRLAAAYLLGSCLLAATVLYDLDHIGILIAKGIPVTAINLLEQSSRSMHHELFLFACLGLYISFASLVRLCVSLEKHIGYNRDITNIQGDNE